MHFATIKSNWQNIQLILRSRNFESRWENNFKTKWIIFISMKWSICYFKNKSHDIIAMPVHIQSQMSCEYTSQIFKLLHKQKRQTKNLHLSPIIIMACNASNKTLYILLLWQMLQNLFPFLVMIQWASFPCFKQLCCLYPCDDETKCVLA